MYTAKPELHAPLPSQDFTFVLFGGRLFKSGTVSAVYVQLGCGRKVTDPDNQFYIGESMYGHRGRYLGASSSQRDRLRRNDAVCVLSLQGGDKQLTKERRKIAEYFAIHEAAKRGLAVVSKLPTWHKAWSVEDAALMKPWASILVDAIEIAHKKRGLFQPTLWDEEL